MLKDHPNVTELEGFLRHPSRPEVSAHKAQMVRHLLNQCPLCREQLERKGWPSQRLERMVHLMDGDSSREMPWARPAQNDYSYDQAFARAEEVVAEFLTAAPPPAYPPDSLMAELDALSRKDQELLAADARFASPGVVKRLIERSHRDRYDDPERMLHWANLAQSL